MNSCPYGLEALRRYREQRAENPPPEERVAPLVQAQAEDEDAPLELDADEVAAEDDFDDLFERWMDRFVESQLEASGPDIKVEGSEAAR